MKAILFAAFALLIAFSLTSCNTEKEKAAHAKEASTAAETDAKSSSPTLIHDNDGTTQFTWKQVEAMLAYEKAQGTRNLNCTEKEWNKMIKLYNQNVIATLKTRSYATPELIAAFSVIPRPYLSYDYEGEKAYMNKATKFHQVMDIGWGATMSASSIQAFMTAHAEPEKDDIALEIGTGSGMQASILSRMVKKVYTIEIRDELAQKVHKTLDLIGYDNIERKIGDGYYGWEEKGPFDLIVVTCQANHIPPALIKQLKPDGRLIIPVGPRWSRKQQLLKVWKDEKTGKVKSKRLMASTLFIPMLGANEESEKKKTSYEDK